MEKLKLLVRGRRFRPSLLLDFPYDMKIKIPPTKDQDRYSSYHLIAVIDISVAYLAGV